ncbi:MAG: rhomboid family intramembrane serine protease [Eubacteriales bacterium]|nr:rhomboid family intramembrane serine protease [Eubacteriales bacterium]
MKKIKPYYLTILFIVVNVILFLLTDLTGGATDTYHMIRWGAEYAPLVQKGEYYRLFTSMFLHFGIEHLMSNMLILGAFGERMEPALGHWKYAVIYLCGGIAGNLVSLGVSFSTGEYHVSAGASGAVFAILGAMIYVVLYHKGKYGEISIRRLLLMTILSIYIGFSEGGVDNAAHIGGLLAGGILTMLLYHPGRKTSNYQGGNET